MRSSSLLDTIRVNPHQKVVHSLNALRSKGWSYTPALLCFSKYYIVLHFQHLKHAEDRGDDTDQAGGAGDVQAVGGALGG